MNNKLTNLIFAFTFLAVAHHLYAGSGNPWDPRGLSHDDSQNVADSQDEHSSRPEELE